MSISRTEYQLKPWECHKACSQCELCQADCDVAKAAQRKLLEYLIERLSYMIQADGMDYRVVNQHTLKMLLKELK